MSGFRLGLIRGKLLTLQSESLFVDSYLSLLIHHFQSVPGFAIFEHIEIPRVNVSVGDIVDVVVLDVDEKKKRISLSMKQAK